MSLAPIDGVNPTVVEDSLSVAVEGTVAQADVEQSKLRPSLPRACKKSRTPQVQHTGKPNGKPKLPSERELAPATKKVAHVVPASGTRVVEGQSARASLPRACNEDHVGQMVLFNFAVHQEVIMTMIVFRAWTKPECMAGTNFSKQVQG